MTEEKKNILTVTQLNNYIKMLIDSDGLLSSVFVKGEISNFTNHRSGHLYFTIKDEGSLIRGVMFRSAASKLKFVPENGMKIIAHGRVSAFVRDGQYQLYVDDMQPDGIGSLYFAFEQLKKKLESEGLFDPRRKRPLPKIPARVGIITSPTGAAVRDIINILGRRFPFAKAILYPALVQGPEAPEQLIAGLSHFNDSCPVDVIIIGRGGGSIEDLWAFNDEGLARAIAASVIPVISAVGHETDFTICDFVADRRAPTPSAAAEIAVPETAELKEKFNYIITKTASSLNQIIAQKKELLRLHATRRPLLSPERLTDDRRMLVLSLHDRMIRTVESSHLLKRNLLAKYGAQLDALSPLAILSRGYSVSFAGDGRIVRSTEDVKPGDSIQIKVTDGIIHGAVSKVEQTL
ncbi:MAG: exodeoxyribonuclease VII large subunit [Clostridiales bacterium]|nr:exodeoxyribonuclease VII large subunit [Clostridiales bacterium]